MGYLEEQLLKQCNGIVMSTLIRSDILWDFFMNVNKLHLMYGSNWHSPSRTNGVKQPKNLYLQTLVLTSHCWLVSLYWLQHQGCPAPVPSWIASHSISINSNTMIKFLTEQILNTLCTMYPETDRRCRKKKKSIEKPSGKDSIRGSFTRPDLLSKYSLNI